MQATFPLDRSAFNVDWRIAAMGSSSSLSTHCFCGDVLNVCSATKLALPYSHRGKTANLQHSNLYS